MGHSFDKANLLHVDVLEQKHLPDLVELIEKQASYHGAVFKGSPERLIEDINNPASPPHVNLFYDAETQKPLAYTLDLKYFKGNHVYTYMEDLFADSKSTKQHGVGSATFDALKKQAYGQGSEKLCFSVMQENQKAIEFYTRNGAHLTDKINWDLSHLLQEEEILRKNFALSANRIQTANAHHIYKHSAQNSKELEISTLMQNHVHSTVLCAADQSDQEKGRIIANANYSSFRTVTGLQLEPIEMTARHAKMQSVETALLLMRAAVKYAHDSQKTGHLYAYTHQQDTMMNSFFTALNGKPLQMNARPSSVFCNMSVGTKPQHTPDIDGDEPSPPSL